MSQRRGMCWLGFLLCLVGCSQEPPYYPVPEQRAPLRPSQGTGLLPFVEMSAPEASDHFVKDISPALEAGTWRWTGPEPTLRFVLDRIQQPKLVVDFAVAAVTFRETGPVTVSFYVNGQLLDRVRYTAPGNKHFEEAVDPSWLQEGQETIVSMRVEPVWVSPTDGNRLGIILIRAGFVD